MDVPTCNNGHHIMYTIYDGALKDCTKCIEEAASLEEES